MTFQPEKRKRAKRKHTKHQSIEERGIAESGPHDGDGDCAFDESRGPQSGDRRKARVAGDCAGGGRDCERDSKGRAAALCRSRVERENGSAGRGRVSTDVWDFAQAGAAVDRGGKARDYPCGGRGRGFDAKRRAGFEGKETDEKRR